MSDFGLFESDDLTQREPRAQARTASLRLAAAIDQVRRDFGKFLMGATGIDEFGDRWHLSKNDIRKTVEAHVFPNTGTMRRVHNAMKADWKLAHPYKVALSHEEAGFGSMPEGDSPPKNLDTDETYHPSSGNLIPEGDFEGWKDSVDQGGPEKVSEHAFTPGGDSGSNKHAGLIPSWNREAGKHTVDPIGGRDDQLYFGQDDDNPPYTNPYTGEPVDWGHPDYPGETGDWEGDPEEGHFRDRREAARLVADIYTDFARANGLRVASLDTLDHYAATGIADADYRLLQSMIIRQAESEECDDDEDDDSEAPEAPKGEESEVEDDPEDSEDFGGEDDAEEEDEEEDEDYGFGDDADGDGDHDDADHHGGETFTVPDHAPELPPEMMQEIPQDDPSGSAPVPPEVIDSLLGLPEGTIEQLLLEEVEQGGAGDPGISGAPMLPEGDSGMGAPQGGGDDFFGGDGDDAEQEQPPRTAHRRRRANMARRFWAAEGDQEQESEGGGEQAAPAQDPAAGGAPMDPAAMGMGQPMMPPPGSGAVAPPAPPQPMEDQPAEDALLDTANQAIMQMIDRETQEYQQIIDPLSQALQAIQFAQQVEQAEHPMDVTPPQGTVDVSPSAAPGGQPPMQQQAMRRRRTAADDGDPDPYGIGAAQAYSDWADANGHGYTHDSLDEYLKGNPLPENKASSVRDWVQWVADNTDEDTGDISVGTYDSDDLIDQWESNHATPGWAESTVGKKVWQEIQDRADLPEGEGGDDVYHWLNRWNRKNPPREAKKRVVLKNAARLIASRYGLSHGGERMLIEAMGRRNYEHVREALQLLPPGHLSGPEHRAAVRHIGEMFAADNPRFNRDLWMKSVLGSASRGRLPFDRPRRTAGETWKHTPTMDAFEWESDEPRVSDNNPHTDLPKMPGALLGSKPQDAVSRFQRWMKWREQNGLVVPGGEGGVHTWMQKTRNPAKPKVGPRASGDVHRSVGAEPDQPKLAPKPKVQKAVNPTLKKPEAKPKATPKAAAFFLDGPNDDPHADPSRLHCSRCGHSGPGASDDDDVMCPKCPGAVMDYKFYGHPTERLIEDFRSNPDSNYGDALFEELKHRSDIDGDQHATDAISPFAWEGDRSADRARHPSSSSPGGEHRPGRPVPRSDYELPLDADPRFNRGLLSNRRDATWGEWEPAKRASSSFFTRGVPGWRWDDHLNGYISKEGKAFTCACGQKVAAPSYKSCDCGKVWNVYAIGGAHHLASDSAEMFIAREIEVRPGVIMANRRVAKGDCDCWDGYCRVPGTKPCAEGSCEKCDSHRRQSNVRRLAGGGMSYEDAMRHIDEALAAGEGHELHNFPGAPSRHEHDFDAEGYCAGCGNERPDNWDDEDEMAMCPGCGEIGRKDDMSVIEGRRGDLHGGGDLDYHCDDCADEIAGPVCGERGCGNRIYAEGHHEDCPLHGRTASAEARFQQNLARLKRFADWTKYDDVDPTVEAYGKTKPPSTKAPRIPRDWAKRNPNGTWKNTDFAPRRK